ncbi:chromate transporter [Paraburkholderia sp. WSM4177]|nr:chromate transporter [Paraburkholderia sp. WSM4177]MBB5488059.1 chromate transporter [Paraburkholderia sp. WSM4180]
MNNELSSPEAALALAPTPTLREIFGGFLGLGLISFGGALPLARRALVEQRRWLTSDEFTDLLGLCQFLPGGNVINLSVAIGMRFRGVPGALAGLLGLIAGPSLAVIGSACCTSTRRTIRTCVICSRGSPRRLRAC